MVEGQKRFVDSLGQQMCAQGVSEIRTVHGKALNASCWVSNTRSRRSVLHLSLTEMALPFVVVARRWKSRRWYVVVVVVATDAYDCCRLLNEAFLFCDAVGSSAAVI